jgi:tetratricopeptide (TPR) repeat protein
VHDLTVRHIEQNNFPARPVHFAVTIGGDNAMGLDQFTIMEGMVYTLVEERRNREIDVAATARLVDSVYRFRGLGNPDVYINSNTAGLLTNYSATNFRLAGWAQDSLQKVQARLQTLAGATSSSAQAERAALEAERDSLTAFAAKYLRLNATILPGEWRVHYYAGQLYQVAGKTAKADSAWRAGMVIKNPNARIFAMNLAQSYARQGRQDEAVEVLESMVARFPEDLEIAFALSELHQQAGNLPAARDVVAAWLARNPKHEYTSAVAQQLQQMESMLRNQPPAADTPAPSAN